MRKSDIIIGRRYAFRLRRLGRGGWQIEKGLCLSIDGSEATFSVSKLQPNPSARAYTARWTRGGIKHTFKYPPGPFAASARFLAGAYKNKTLVTTHSVPTRQVVCEVPNPEGELSCQEQ